MKKSFKSFVKTALITVLLALVFPLAAVYADTAPVSEYVVKSGDSLYRISKNLLGDGERWQEIFEANRDKIADPARISVGQTLVIPGNDNAASQIAAAPQNIATAKNTAVDGSAPAQVKNELSEQEQADMLAEAMIVKAKKAEPAITAILKALESDKAHLEGLDF